MVKKSNQTLNILDRRFYQNDTRIVAKKLLGKRIIRKINNYKISAIITETEAYGYDNDPASHAFRGMTNRNQAMFGEVGRAYVYFTYGMHYCFNVVARSNSTKAGAILIRAAKPESGIDIMIKNRNNNKNISDGPAKLSQALNITKEQYGIDLTTESELYITRGVNPTKIVSGPRIGISKATTFQWNFKSS